MQCLCSLALALLFTNHKLWDQSYCYTNILLKHDILLCSGGINVADYENKAETFPFNSSLPVSAVMSAKAISEQTGKEFLYRYICTSAPVQNKFRHANVTAETDFERLAQEHPWLLSEVRLRTKTSFL